MNTIYKLNRTGADTLGSGKFWLLLAATMVLAALASVWMFFQTINKPQAAAWPWSTVIAAGLGGGIVVGVIAGLVHRRRRR